ncbi:MAG: helix-turn-helix transcriptional regulator [Oscillospiraceae bacterium]|nr:helix-turn-helix transcriptional regulator [Oscillospiraceae bacterium]
MDGTYYKRLRHKHNLTQEKLARLLGISRHSLSKYEMPNSDMPVTVLFKLNIFFDVDISDMTSKA